MQTRQMRRSLHCQGRARALLLLLLGCHLLRQQVATVFCNPWASVSVTRSRSPWASDRVPRPHSCRHSSCSPAVARPEVVGPASVEAFKELDIGTLLQGTIVGIQKRGVLSVRVTTSAGDAAVGLVGKSHYPFDFNPEVGQEVTVRLLGVHSEQDRLNLSARNLNSQAFEQNSGTSLEGKVQAVKSSGISVWLMSPDGFSALGMVPKSEIPEGLSWHQMEVGRQIRVRVLRVCKDGELQLSMKDLPDVPAQASGHLESDSAPVQSAATATEGQGQVQEKRSTKRLKKKSERVRPSKAALSQFEKDSWLVGTVTGFRKNTVVVRVVGPAGTPADGVVHVKEIRTDHLVDVRKEFSLGEEVRVRVLGVNVWRGELSLSMRKPLFNIKSLAQLSDGNTWLTGRVSAVESFGIFVRLTTPDGHPASGLVASEELNDDESVMVDQEVQVRVLTVDTDALGGSRLTLSMRKLDASDT